MNILFFLQESRFNFLLGMHAPRINYLLFVVVVVVACVALVQITSTSTSTCTAHRPHLPHDCPPLSKVGSHDENRRSPWCLGRYALGGALGVVRPRSL
jgi:hypothetical protein